MQKIALLVVIGAVVGAVMVLNSPKEPSSALVADAENTSAGRMAYIDPETGELTSTPPPGAVLQSRSLFSDQEKEPVRLEHRADGSTKIHFNGRFNKPLVATLDENGQLKINHKEVKHVDSQEK